MRGKRAVLSQNPPCPKIWKDALLLQFAPLLTQLAKGNVEDVDDQYVFGSLQMVPFGWKPASRIKPITDGVCQDHKLGRPDTADEAYADCDPAGLGAGMYNLDEGDGVRQWYSTYGRWGQWCCCC